MDLILASSSPRRSELLSKMNRKFKIVPSDCCEYSFAASPRDVALELACRKAMNVFLKNGAAAVIGCDTVVDLDGEVLGKPKDAQEAVSTLKRLSGRSHEVHTGVCIAYEKGILLFSDTSKVKFKVLDCEQIDKYVSTGSPMDKAGAYGIQDSGFVSEIIGSYTNVMGFPVEKIERALKNIIK